MNKELKEMREAFTFDEHMRIAFTPNLIIETIFFYSDRVQGWCRDHRVSDTVKLSRRLDEIKRFWYSELRKDLTQENIDFIKTKAEEWRNLMELHLTQLWFTMGNALLKVYESQEYLEVINNALTAMMMIDIAKEYNVEKNKLIEQRLPNWERHVAPIHPMLNAVYAIMEAYIPGEGSPWDDIPPYWRNTLFTAKKLFMEQLKSISYS